MGAENVVAHSAVGAQVADSFHEACAACVADEARVPSFIYIWEFDPEDIVGYDRICKDM